MKMDVGVGCIMVTNKNLGITGIEIAHMADDAISIRDEMIKAEQIKCTCNNFILQYQGCNCKRGKSLKKVMKRSNDFFAGL